MFSREDQETKKTPSDATKTIPNVPFDLFESFPEIADSRREDLDKSFTNTKRLRLQDLVYSDTGMPVPKDAEIFQLNSTGFFRNYCNGKTVVSREVFLRRKYVFKNNHKPLSRAEKYAMTYDANTKRFLSKGEEVIWIVDARSKVKLRNKKLPFVYSFKVQTSSENTAKKQQGQSINLAFFAKEKFKITEPPLTPADFVKKEKTISKMPEEFVDEEIEINVTRECKPLKF